MSAIPTAMELFQVDSMPLPLQPDKVLDFFPSDKFPEKFPGFRKYQERTIVEIAKAFATGVKYVIVEAPTGAGKSVTAVTIARWFAAANRQSFVLTTQKVLQDQYQQDFKSLTPVIKGRANFQCIFTNEPASNCLKRDFGADEQTIVTDQGKFDTSRCQHECPYLIQRQVGMESPITMLNYAYYMMVNSFGDFGKRKFVVFDEGHNIENVLMGTVTFEFWEKQIQKLTRESTLTIPQFKTVETALEWLENLWENKLKVYYDEARKDFDSMVTLYQMAKEISVDRLRQYQRVVNSYEAFRDNIRFVKNNKDLEWVLDANTAGVIFKPVFVHKVAQKQLFDRLSQVLIVSATINPQVLTKSLGMPADQVKYIAVPSTFPAENRPIYSLSTAKLSHKVIDQSLPLVVRDVEQILRNHEGQRGIIHANTYKIRNYIMDNLSPDLRSRLMTHDSHNREETIYAFYNSKPGTVLISPSMTEGLDLKGEKSEFQIIVKIPWPYLGDAQIKRRMELDPVWYTWQAVRTIVQAYGRSIRSTEDKAVTYILDAGFNWFLSQNDKMFPNDFRVAVRKGYPDWANDEFFDDRKPRSLSDPLTVKQENEMHDFLTQFSRKT